MTLPCSDIFNTRRNPTIALRIEHKSYYNINYNTEKTTFQCIKSRFGTHATKECEIFCSDICRCVIFFLKTLRLSGFSPLFPINKTLYCYLLGNILQPQKFRQKHKILCLFSAKTLHFVIIYKTAVLRTPFSISIMP